MNRPVNERELVLDALIRIIEQNVFSHVALNQLLTKYQYLDKKQRAFITRVTEGTLEHMLEIDYILDQFSSVKVKKMKPVIRNILRSAVYQLKYLDNVPDAAVCNEAVNLAVKRGFKNLRGFVNGVLRGIARNLDQIVYPQERLAFMEVKYSIPAWMLELWLSVYDEDTVEKIAASFQQQKRLTIRTNIGRTTPKELQQNLEKEGIKVQAHPYLPYAFQISGIDYLGGLETFQKGDFYIQDISSMLVGELAALQAGDYVIDVCAAPGGKALHLAEKLMAENVKYNAEHHGQVEARDLTAEKVAFIQENIKRSGLSNIRARQMDALVKDEDSVGKANIVIADLPCSGLGILGKKADLRYKASKESLAELVSLQRKILTQVCSYVAPGGTLLFSTCTINPGENIENVHWFLEQFAEFQLDDISHRLCQQLQADVQENGCLQLLPGIHESDGFFMARFVRSESD